MSENEEIQYRIIDLSTKIETNSSRNFTGKARVFYPNGDIYEGEFIDGIRCGEGMYEYKNKYIYEGNWKDNLKNGIGKFEYGKKGSYSGYFQNGKRHGEGIYTFPNGDTYSGKWKWGKKFGKGVYSYKEDNVKVEGVWENGDVINGKWILSNGIYYEGDFKNNKPSGDGSWNFPSKDLINGQYIQERKNEEEEEEDGKENEEENEDEEEGNEKLKKPKDLYKIKWEPNLDLYNSAKLVNEQDIYAN